MSKPQDPFAAMPKGNFDMDDFKRFYSNNDEDKSVPYFWEKFDSDNYSIWRCDYKYNDELAMVFMSCNLIGGEWSLKSCILKAASLKLLCETSKVFFKLDHAVFSRVFFCIFYTSLLLKCWRGIIFFISLCSLSFFSAGLFQFLGKLRNRPCHIVIFGIIAACLHHHEY